LKNTEIVSKAIDYINSNKKYFIELYTKDIIPQTPKSAIFMAGMSGVGKTEFASFLQKQNRNLLHIDTDNIRDFFEPVGYNGTNSEIFQKPASKGYSKLFDHAMKKGLSVILDSNLSSVSKAVENIDRLLAKDYIIEIYYLYNDPQKCFEYAVKREVVTKRKVPYDVFVKSNVDSFYTIIELKKRYNTDIVLHFLDKRINKLYEDINVDFLIQELGEYYDTYR